jgi:hypothetical protein
MEQLRHQTIDDDPKILTDPLAPLRNVGWPSRSSSSAAGKQTDIELTTVVLGSLIEVDIVSARGRAVACARRA